MELLEPDLEWSYLDNKRRLLEEVYLPELVPEIVSPGSQNSSSSMILKRIRIEHHPISDGVVDCDPYSIASGKTLK